MSTRKLIGKVSATEKNPSSCDEFQFWMSDDTILSPFDIVLVQNKTDDSITYGVVQDIFHITDGTGHISNYVSSDFGNVDIAPMTHRLSLSYAKVSVIHNTKENFMPVFEGSAVYTANEDDIQVALGLDNIDEKSAIPAGLMKAGNNVSVPIKFNGDFLIGPEGAHMNISGISGLATKTSYVMFLLKAIQHKCKDDVAIIVMNVRGDDLLHVHQPNEKITNAQRKDWDDLGVPCTPFENVKYLYPYRQQKDKLYANTALPVEDLTEQFNGGQAANFIYTFEHDISKVDMLFSNVDDPNYTIESILNYIDYGSEFKGDLSWANFKEVLKEFCSKGSDKKDKSSILIQSWQRFRRLINNSINDDIFVNAKSSKKEQHQVYLSDEIARLAIKPLRIAFDDIKLKDTYCAAVRTAHRHGIKEISNYILFNYKDKPEDLYERLKINIELNRELGIQIFSFPMKYSPINRTDRSYIGVNWTKKSIRAISAILQVTKGVVAAGSDFFYKAFGNTLEEYFELLAMPRELIMFRHHFEENGTTATWKKLYQAMSDEQKKELMEFTSHTVAELKQTPCPEQFREILPYYLIKYNGKKDQMGDGAVQLSLMDDSDIVFEDQ